MSFYPDIPKSFNLQSNHNHPILPDPHENITYRKYVSVHSEDRDINKHPNSAEFDIEMPEDITNVVSIRLSDWTFPSNYSTFSTFNSNIAMTFKITTPYNPGEHSYNEELIDSIFACLFLSKELNYSIQIEEGFYNPDQMVNELTNKFNEAVTLRIQQYLTDQGKTDLLERFNALGGYSNFVIVYNSVSQKIWFGNTTDGFVLTNETQSLKYCANRSQLPDSVNWGLPNNLGLSKANAVALSTPGFTPRFYYGNVTGGDNGYWLIPNQNLPGTQCYYVECPYKINLMGPAYFYMELEGQNCIDETSPYNLSKFTAQTNETNGRVNSSFAKIAIPTTPISQWFDRDSMPYKLYVPPAERVRRLKIRLRYHNGQVVNFGVYDYSFTLEFVIMQPQQMQNLRRINRQL
jgi:hypothetical protein